MLIAYDVHIPHVELVHVHNISQFPSLSPFCPSPPPYLSASPPPIWKRSHCPFPFLLFTYNLVFLYKRNCVTLKLVCLIPFTQHYGRKVYPSSHTTQIYPSLWKSSTPLCRYHISIHLSVDTEASSKIQLPCIVLLQTWARIYHWNMMLLTLFERCLEGEWPC